jgi:hypothetical protein
MRFQMKLTAQNIIALAFAVFSFVSLGFILAASLNYNDYYWQARSAILDPASNNTIVRSVVVIRDPNTGQIAIRARVSATNPTGYQGLTLDQFAVTLFCFHTGNISQSIFTPVASNLLANVSPTEDLGPYSTVTSDLNFSLNATQTSQLQAFNQTYNGDIQAHTVMITRVNSFFDTVFGPMTNTKEQALPILWS